MALERYGLYLKALGMFESALAIRLQAFGEEHVALLLPTLGLDQCLKNKATIQRHGNRIFQSKRRSQGARILREELGHQTEDRGSRAPQRGIVVAYSKIRKRKRKSEKNAR